MNVAPVARSNVRHAGLLLEHPVSWEVVLDLDPTTPVTLLPDREHEDGFASSLVITFEPVGRASLDEWQRPNELMLREALTDFRTIDLQRCSLAGHEGATRLALHRAQQTPVTLCQWMAVTTGVGLTVSLTCPTLVWPRLWRAVNDVVGSLVIQDLAAVLTRLGLNPGEPDVA